MMAKILSPTAFAPQSVGFVPGIAYSYALGFLTKWNDILGDKEIDITEQTSQVLQVISTIVHTATCCHFSSVNNECLGLCLGLITGCLLGGKLDIYIHAVPSFVVPLFHAIVYFYFKQNKWSGLDYTGTWAKNLGIIYGHVFFVSAVDEIAHEIFENHPNGFVNMFFDRRLFSDAYTLVLWLLSMKNLLPFGLGDICDWNKMFLYPLFFGWGYDLMRFLRPKLNERLAL